MKTLEGILAKAEIDGGDGKVSFIVFDDTSWESLPPSEKYDIDKMLRDGRGGPFIARSIKSYPRERHLLPSGGVELASVRASRAKEEV